MSDYRDKPTSDLFTRNTQININVDDNYTDAFDALTPIINSLWFNNLKMKPMLIFHPYAPNGEIIRDSDHVSSSGGKAMPKHYISDCYGFSPDGEWFKLVPPPANQYKVKGWHGWSKINQVHKLNKEMVVRAMLLKESF